MKDARVTFFYNCVAMLPLPHAPAPPWMFANPVARPGGNVYLSLGRYGEARADYLAAAEVPLSPIPQIPGTPCGWPGGPPPQTGGGTQPIARGGGCLARNLFPP